MRDDVRAELSDNGNINLRVARDSRLRMVIIKALSPAEALELAADLIQLGSGSRAGACSK